MQKGFITMATILPPADYLSLLHCPCSPGSSLLPDHTVARCDQCGREFPIREGIMLEMVDSALLDEETARELQGNSYQATEAQIEHLMQWERQEAERSYYVQSRRPEIQILATYLETLDTRQLISLGSGTAREIAYLLQFKALDTVFCSDLSGSVLAMAPYRLAPYDLKLGLFTSNLAQCPVKPRDIPIIIVNALHHTQNMHVSIEELLRAGYHNILFMEATNNALIRFLSRWGVAQRVEYSGLKPGRLDLSVLRALSERYGYHLKVTTRWRFPPDYFKRLFKNAPLARRFLLAFLNILSKTTGFVQFGNVSIVHLQKQDAP